MKVTVVEIHKPSKGGRPRVDEPKSFLSVRLPVRQHDRLIKLANQLGVSVSSVARDLLDRRPDPRKF